MRPAIERGKISHLLANDAEPEGAEMTYRHEI
jgi:hypothetical protein